MNAQRTCAIRNNENSHAKTADESWILSDVTEVRERCTFFRYGTNVHIVIFKILEHSRFYLLYFRAGRCTGAINGTFGPSTNFVVCLPIFRRSHPFPPLPVRPVYNAVVVESLGFYEAVVKVTAIAPTIGSRVDSEYRSSNSRLSFYTTVGICSAVLLSFKWLSAGKVSRSECR